MPQSILWLRLDQPGHEYARLASLNTGWELAGVAVFAQDRQPCRLEYSIECDKQWQTRSASVSGWVGSQPVDIEISIDADQRWLINLQESEAAAGCIDLDLNFSPVTNLLPIRRLGLKVGEQAAVKAAWLRFPSFTLEPLEQSYRRIDAGTYRYESAGGRFVRDLRVDASGFVTHYPDFWQVEAST